MTNKMSMLLTWVFVQLENDLETIIGSAYPGFGFGEDHAFDKNFIITFYHFSTLFIPYTIPFS